MSLLAFMQYMTDHPDEMNEYKRNPKAFFDKHPDIALSEKEQLSLQHYPNKLADEATTIGRTSTTLPPPDANTNAALSDNVIYLENLQIYVFAHSEAHVFFAEPLPAKPEESVSIQCFTLPHSWFFFDGINRHFDFHVCYTDPNDESDRTQVLYITTELEGHEPPVGATPCGHILMTLTIPPFPSDRSHPGYILALARHARFTDNPISLQRGSYYHPRNGELVLIFDAEDLPGQ